MGCKNSRRRHFDYKCVSIFLVSERKPLEVLVMIGFWMDANEGKEKPLIVEKLVEGSRHKKETGALVNGHSVKSKGDANDKRQLYYQRKMERLGHGKVKQEGSLRSEEYEKEIDIFNSDIEAILSPFKQMEKSDSKIDRGIIKYFALVVILLPSIIGIMTPAMGENGHTSIDMANLVTDSFMVILVSWFINFTIEWPWNWHKNIIEAQSKLLESTNAFVHRVSTTEEVNSEILTKKIKAFKKLCKYENYSLLLCFVCTCVGAGIMRWSRNYINIEDTRRRLVFSNLNIMLFLFLEIFRLVLILTERLQRHTIDDIQDKINKDSVKSNGLKTAHMDLVIPSSSSSEDNNKMGGLMNGLGSLVTTGKLNANIEGGVVPYKKSIELLQDKANRQDEMIQSLLITQANEYAKINMSLKKLEKVISQINNHKNEGLDNQRSIFLKPFPLNLSSSENKLTQKSYKRLSLPSMLNNDKQPMHTIFEESDLEEEDGEENQLNGELMELQERREQEARDEKDIGKMLGGIVDKQEKFSDNISKRVRPQKLNSSSTNLSSFNESIFEQPHLHRIDIKQSDLENVSDYNSNYFDEDCGKEDKQKGVGSGHFSLHGLPFSSSIKNLVTRNLVYEDNNSNIPYIPDNLLDYGMNELIGYGSEQLSIMGNMEEKNSNILFKLKLIVLNILQNISIIDLIKDPLTTKQILHSEITPILMSFCKEQIENYTATIRLLKSLIWELLTKHLFLTTEKLETIINIYLAPLERLKNLFTLVCFKIPFNILKFYMAVLSFLPKIFYHIFIAYPIINQTSKDKGSDGAKRIKNIDHREPGSKPFLAMKQFHLSPNTARSDKIKTNTESDKALYDLKARKMVFNKLLRYYDLRTLPENSLFTPVRLYDEE